MKTKIIKTKWPLYLLLLMFLSPMIAAFYVLYGREPPSFNTVQHGTLIQPALKLSLNLKPHKWYVLYMRPTSCSAECQARQQTIRKLHIALGKDQDRVIFASHTTDEIGIVAQEESILVIDPLGFYIMHYPPQAKLSGLLKDLKRLLKYSHAS